MVGVTHYEVQDMADLVSCKCEKVPFDYFGLLVGKDMSPIDNWDTMLNKLLGRLHLYFLSIFMVPMTFLKKFENLHNKFF